MRGTLILGDKSHTVNVECFTWNAIRMFDGAAIDVGCMKSIGLASSFWDSIGASRARPAMCTCQRCGAVGAFRESAVLDDEAVSTVVAIRVD